MVMVGNKVEGNVDSNVRYGYLRGRATGCEGESP